MNAFERLREQLPMIQVAERYGFPVKRGYLLCPFHTEKTPSLKLYPGDRGWWCFGCGVGGSVIDFAMLLFGLTPLEAAKRLDADFCLGLMHDPPESCGAGALQGRKAKKGGRKAPPGAALAPEPGLLPGHGPFDASGGPRTGTGGAFGTARLHGLLV